MRLQRWCNARPWRHWLVLAAALLLYFSVTRIVSLSISLAVFTSGSTASVSATTVVSVLALGVAEDAALVTFLLVALSAVDALVGPQSIWTQACPYPTSGSGVSHAQTAVRRLLRLVLHVSLLLMAVAPFAADVLLLRLRGMRFTFQYLDLYLREIQFQSGFAVDPHEVTIALSHLTITVVIVLVLLAVHLGLLDFSQWHLAKLFMKERNPEKSLDDLEANEERTASSPESEPEPDEIKAEQTQTQPSSPLQATPRSMAKQDSTVQSAPSQHYPIALTTAFPIVLPIALLSLVFTLLLCLTHAVAAAVSASALNNSLNELFRLTLGVQFLKPLGDGHLPSAAFYLDASTESYQLFRDDVLYRKTTGFKGPLAFNVSIDPTHPPNVFVIVVESFRYLDSLYLVGNQSARLLERQGNMTLTPHFDRWAKRGVGFRNLWSSWQTSRSVESILYGQVPYDDPTRTGTTTGHTDVQLAGLPQFFKQKGYETLATSGSHMNYDQWDQFLPAHGFERVLEQQDFMDLAEETKGINPSDWWAATQGGEERKFTWGVHDDLSFEILGDIVVEKIQAQQTRVANGEPKTPLFLTHYTISSHSPFESTPVWYANVSLPDFSALARGKGYDAEIQRYAKLRYFTDMELGNFLDRMETEGVLNDTIVVVVGDHGQSPESGLTNVDVDQIATTRVAGMLIAEGRLGTHAGLVIDEAAEHYDLLNTLTDIVGVPDGGFLQSGVGRSLKRTASSSGSPRPVWTNNPLRQLAVVQGHRRLSYDRVLSTMKLHDAENDPDEMNDLFEALSLKEKDDFEHLAEAGRQLSRYFHVRWDNRCITQIDC